MPLFVVVAFGFSWAVAALIWTLEPGPLPRVAMMMVFMAGPAVGAVVAQRRLGQPIRALGFRFSLNRWWLVAWLSPVVMALVVGAVGLLMPGVTFSSDMSGMLDRFTLPPDQLAEATAQLARFSPPALFAIQLVQALMAAISINAVAALGEELGWRGFVHEHLPSLRHQLWRRALVVGAMWGVWHAPIILLGHNYPDHPVAGVAMMVVFCVLLAPWFEHIRDKTGSVLAASVMHGSVNASAGFGILFLRGGSDLMVGVTGLAGFIVLAVANVVLAVVRHRRA